MKHQVVKLCRRRYRTVRLQAAVLLFALLQGTGYAQDPGVPLQGPPRYTVELIVFAYNDGASAGSEIFVPDRPADEYHTGDPNAAAAGAAELVFEDPTGSGRGDDGSGDVPGAGAASPVITGDGGNPGEAPLRDRIELRLLEPPEYTMDAIYAELVRLDAYHPILRAAWTQTALAQEVSPAVQLRALADLPPGLDGSVTLYQGRFVHLGLDLTLDAAAGEGDGEVGNDRRAATDRAIAYGDARVRGQGADGDDGLLGGRVRYHISESRIMKDGDIRYYDHPRFGVLAKVTEAADERAEHEASSVSDGAIR